MSTLGALVLAAIVAIALGGLLLALRSREGALRQASSLDTASRLDRLLTETASARQASESVDRRFEELRRSLEERVQGVEKNLREGQKSVADHLGQMREKIGMVFEASQKIERLATDMTRLEDLLKPPKLRGAIGERFLEQALAQVLPAHCWKMQYRFPDGSAVDAAVFVGERFVSVDSKFPLDNYRRSREAADEGDRKKALKDFGADVRRHIETIREKYIRPECGTFDFALMYIPAEAVYCEVAGEGIEDSLADYALERKVVPVSPRLLYAYLATVAMGLRGLELQESARDVQDKLSDLARLWDRVEVPFEKVGVHLSNAQKQYEEASKAVGRFGVKLQGIADGAAEKLEAEALIEPPSLLPPA